MRSYLDHASTAPLRAAARDVMVEHLSSTTMADPGRQHQEGMAARVALEQAREVVASTLGARACEVVFTSGASESIAAAHFGARARRGELDEVICSAVEHSSVRDWAARGPSHVVGVDAGGRVDPDEVMAAVTERTALVDVQWCNHEVGVVQPVSEVVQRCREAGVLVHVDAAQAVGHLQVDFHELGADLMSVSAHKFGGPAGIGALVVRRGLRIPPLIVGGDQERLRRAGMEDVGAALGFAAACDDVHRHLDDEVAASTRMTQRVIDWADAADGVSVLGDRAHRSAHLVCLGITDVEPQPVLIGLDRAGVAVHSGSSCSTESLEPSPVLAAMGVDAARSLRISTGWNTSDADVDLLLAALPEVLEGLRALAGNAR